MTTQTPVILIVEDGNEYLENLSRFVPGPTYLQVKSGSAALETLDKQSVDLVYLDMRFDRIPQGDLMGDHIACTREHNGDPVRALKHLQNNQGLYILAALRKADLGNTRVILSYDFSLELKRFEHLSKLYPNLRWVPDTVTPDEIRGLIEELLSED